MPMYDFTCAACGATAEHVVAYAERDTALVPCDCGAPMTRAGVSGFKAGGEPFQMRAVLNDGSHVRGHFGKTARLRRR